MKNNIRIFIVIAILLGAAQMCFAGATQVDALIEKLVEKDILSKAEAIKLKGEIAADEKLAREEGLKQSLPSWVQGLKLKGDLRLRTQWERRQHAAEERYRGRIRYRLGMETKVSDSVIVAAGIASGGDDPRSTNQTFENSFQHPDLRLDYAYAEFTPPEVKGLKMAGGKFLMKDYLWTPTDLLWDTDINPEGGSLHYEHQIVKGLTGYLNTGIWVIDENGATDRSDPFMHNVQGGVKIKNENLGVEANLAGVYYAFHGLKASDLDHEKNTNTQRGGVADGVLLYDYDSAGVSAEVSLKKPLGFLGVDQVEHAAVFGDYIHNVDSGDGRGKVDDGYGWALGARLGDKKVTNWAQWQLKYIYAHLEKDAFPDIFPDSDRYGGSTDMRGHEVMAEFGINKNTTVGLDYYQIKRLRASEATEHLFQGDIVFKF
ncbi:MAG: hypothetical protein A2787_07420 [Omnitrophica WOR_2 bacterium RIFCSPHIGHO2_01_FULL_48_9]|nr:MAG: hypothetical protein A2787_07420 [Omnitrophica WOR_2 bacterium RIFCSPHIGHO2_01_FULL_48_9]